MQFERLAPTPNLHTLRISIDEGEQFLADKYGERYIRYRQQFKAAGSYEFEPGFPLYLMVEQTYGCNLTCPSCIHGFPSEKKKFNSSIKVMPFSTFERIVHEGEQNDCPSMGFQGNDEPLLVPDLPRRIAYAKEHNFMDMLVTTNGNLLTPKLAKELVDAGATRILFSLDAATQETYDKVRPGGDFNRVVDNLNALVEYKASIGSPLPIIRASFVNSKINEHERELFIEKFSKIVDYIEIQAFSVYYETNKDIIPVNSEWLSDFNCVGPCRELIIRANGDVLPCCAFYGYEMDLGNIMNTSLKDIFQSEKLKKLRKEFKESVYNPAACNACSKSFYVHKDKSKN